MFDEGHHLFDAADSTFAAAFTGQEAIELRRWMIGPEGRRGAAGAGLAARLMDVASYDEEGAQALEAAVEAARALPSDGWLQRLTEDLPFGPIEALLGAVRGVVYARVEGAGGGLRDGDRAGRARRRAGRARPPRCRRCERAADAARGARRAARGGARGCARLARQRRRARGSRARSAGSSLARARRSPPGSRCSARIGGAADPDFVDWLAVERVDGREFDVGIHRHWLDPTKPLAATVLAAGARRDA